MKKILIILLSFSFNLRADIVTKVDTARKIDAHVKDFIKKVNDLKNSSKILGNQFQCLSKIRVSDVKCNAVKCTSTRSCLYAIFAEFEKIMDPIMLNLVGLIETDKLKPGILTALPLMWDDPKSEKIKQFEHFIIYNFAIPLNNIYDLIKVIKDALDPSADEAKKQLPIEVEEKNIKDMDLDKAPIDEGSPETPTEQTPEQTPEETPSEQTQEQPQTAETQS